MDEELRSLEKDLARDPCVANRVRYANALERLGRRRELHRALCDLAREGDPAARDRVFRWNPWSAREGAGSRRRALDPLRARRVATTVLGFEGLGSIVAAASSDSLLFVDREDDQGIAAIDLRTLAIVWERKGGPLELAGELLCQNVGAAIARCDARTGELEEPIPVECEAFSVVGDRLVTQSAYEVRAFDVTRGSSLWRDYVPGEVLAHTFERVLLREPVARREECYAVESGTFRWKKTLFVVNGRRYDHGRVRPTARGMAGVLVGPRGDADLAFHLDPDTGALAPVPLPRTVRQESLPDAWLDASDEWIAVGRHGDRDARGKHDDVVVVARRGDKTARVVATHEDLRALALAEEALYVLALERAVLAVTGIDPATGATLVREPIQAPFPVSSSWVIPIAGALLVAASEREGPRLFVARVENA